MAGIIMSSVRKNYGAVTAIPDLNLEIADGEFCVFVGPSGCGKSTLLRTIAGLEDLSSGTISIGDLDVSHRHPGERGVAMVFQNYALYPHMNVADNMAYSLKIAGEPKAQRIEKVKKAAAILGLEEFLERKPAELSGGQRQRVAIGRAIVRNPKVFLFDEPLSNLDAELRTRMRLELADLHQKLDATMVYVTHDQVEAMTLADKIVVLRAGKIEQIGAPLDLYDNPNNLFVARFIGSPSMNFFNASSTGESLVLSELDNTPVAIDVQAHSDADLVLGVRPEHLEVDPNGPKIKLNAVEHLGGVTYGYAILPSGAEFCIDLKGQRDIKAGAEIGIRIPVERALVFDKKTELRLV